MKGGGDEQRPAGGFDEHLRLHAARGDPSPHTIRSYHTHAAQYLRWCADHEIDPVKATEEDMIAYRHDLVGQYTPDTYPVKLAAVRRLYEVAAVGCSVSWYQSDAHRLDINTRCCL